MAGGVVLPKAIIQQRLLVTIPGAGRRTLTTELRLRDIAEHTGVSHAILRLCAHRKREVDDSLQVQLSNFFLLFDAGVLVKVKEADAYVVRRIPPKAGVREPVKATIDLRGLVPRINWSR